MFRDASIAIKVAEKILKQSSSRDVELIYLRVYKCPRGNGFHFSSKPPENIHDDIYAVGMSEDGNIVRCQILPDGKMIWYLADKSGQIILYTRDKEGRFIRYVRKSS